MVTRTVAGRTFTYSHCVGRNSMAGNGFRYPVDFALAAGDVAYVLNWADEANPGTRVTKLTLGEEHILDFGSYGDGDGQFTRVTSLVIDRDETVYVSDEWLNRISIFDSEGNFLRKWGTAGSGDGQLNEPWGLAFDREENLWVVDSGNNRVQKFTKDGEFLAKWGKGGSGEGEFNTPWGITIDNNGDVYVADWMNSRVQKFGPDGQFLMAFGAPGSGEGELRRPTSVAVDEQGDVFVTDWGENKVHVYTAEGDHLTTFTGDAQQLSLWAQMVIDANPDYQKARRRVKTLAPEWTFFYPSAVEVDDQGRIVIADQQRNRLQVYIKERDYIDPQFNL